MIIIITILLEIGMSTVGLLAGGTPATTKAWTPHQPQETCCGIMVAVVLDHVAVAASPPAGAHGSSFWQSVLVWRLSGWLACLPYGLKLFDLATRFMNSLGNKPHPHDAINTTHSEALAAATQAAVSISAFHDAQQLPPGPHDLTDRHTGWRAISGWGRAAAATPDSSLPS